MENDVIMMILEKGGDNVIAIIALYFLHGIKIELTSVKTELGEKFKSLNKRLNSLERMQNGN